MYEKFRSRKFGLSMLIFVTSTGLLVGGYISGEVWKDCVTLVGGAYLAANSWQNIGLSKTPKSE